jgi:hypothetical protein
LHKGGNHVEKWELGEAGIKAKYTTPAIVDAGWNELTQILLEVAVPPMAHGCSSGWPLG